MTSTTSPAPVASALTILRGILDDVNVRPWHDDVKDALAEVENTAHKLETIREDVEEALEYIGPEDLDMIDQVLRAALDKTAPEVPMPIPHDDDVAVFRFVSHMRDKLAKMREQGRDGWQNKDAITTSTLSSMLRHCVEKGDPVDVANLAMMLQQRGETIAHDAPVMISTPLGLLPCNSTGMRRLIDVMAACGRFVRLTREAFEAGDGFNVTATRTLARIREAFDALPALEAATMKNAEDVERAETTLARLREAIRLQALQTALPRELLDVARGILAEHPFAPERIRDLEQVCRKLQDERDEQKARADLMQEQAQNALEGYNVRDDEMRRMHEALVAAGFVADDVSTRLVRVLVLLSDFRTERNTAVELVDAFKAAALLDVGGDPGGVTPALVEAEITRLRKLVEDPRARRSAAWADLQSTNARLVEKFTALETSHTAEVARLRAEVERLRGKTGNGVKLGDRVRYGDDPKHVGTLECLEEGEGVNHPAGIKLKGNARIRRDADHPIALDHPFFWSPLESLILVAPGSGNVDEAASLRAEVNTLHAERDRFNDTVRKAIGDKYEVLTGETLARTMIGTIESLREAIGLVAVEVGDVERALTPALVAKRVRALRLGARPTFNGEASTVDDAAAEPVKA